MSLKYKVIKIYTSEDIHWHGKVLYNAIIEYIRSLKLAARCSINRGIAGCYETGEVSTQNLLDLSYNLPITIEIILPAVELEMVLSHLEEMVVDGIIAIHELEVRSYHSSKHLIPRQLKVKEVMTAAPKTVTLTTAVDEVINLMLNHSLKGIPVVDSDLHPLGIITQKDLSVKAGMPIRLGLFNKLDPENINSFLKSITGKTAQDIMSHPVTMIQEDSSLRDAVKIMIKQHLKRLPVVNGVGVLTGIISRIDVFQIISKQAPKWNALREQNVVVNSIQPVKTVLQRELLTVHPDTNIPEVIEKVISNEIQRIAVVDDGEKFLGLISDADILPIVSGHPGFFDLIISKLTFTEKGRQIKEIIQHARAKTAIELMHKNITVIQEDTSIEEAIKIMTDRSLKRLPVVDVNGIYKGMISRDSVLQVAIK
jgi:CBS domain-containing protein